MSFPQIFPFTRRRFLAALPSAAAAFHFGCSESQPPKQAGKKFEPTWDSLKTHQVPDWFHDAKLGIFIHWGLYSVPAWATPTGELGKVDRDKWFANNPYAEWYLNTLRIEGSPTWDHHRKTYGKDFDYIDFSQTFNKEVQAWDPQEWAQLFHDVGARYVVLTSKHHDGWTLWPSEVRNPNRPADRQGCSRDLVGELSNAVRAKGLRMALYYSGGLDWSFNKTPVKTFEDVRGTVIHTEEYARYADAHWRELIRRYQPAILWNDIGYPRQGELKQIFADYYNQFPDGLVNNRFRQGAEEEPHYDFTTPEYARMTEITDYKWESCRGLGFSFGYNQLEGPQQVLSSNDLIEMVADITSKNGNLLLNIGPKPDGSISQIQLNRLQELGAWLGRNGEAIFGTRPWERAEGKTSTGSPLRFTRKDGAIYAILFERPKGRDVLIDSFSPPAGAKVTMLGVQGDLAVEQQGAGLKVTLPSILEGEHAWTLKIEG